MGEDTALVARADEDEVYTNLVGIARGSQQELLRRLKDSDLVADMSTVELNILSGTAVDKIAKRQGWGQKKQDAGPNRMTEFAQLVSQGRTMRIQGTIGEGKASLEVEVGPSSDGLEPSEDRVIEAEVVE